MESLLGGIRAEVRERMKELQPLVEEYEQLEKALEALIKVLKAQTETDEEPPPVFTLNTTQHRGATSFGPDDR